MGRHYPPEYDSYAPNPVGPKTPWLLRTIYEYGVRKRTQTVARVKNAGALLDIGCSTGTFLLGMRKISGFMVKGVEINAQAAEAAIREGLDVRVGTLHQAGFAESVFDVVTLWDVFEHLHDPSAALKEIARILKPSGAVVMRVPNLDSWDARLFGRFWAGLDAPRHTYVFDLRSLRNLLERAGFTDLEMRCNIGSYPTFVLSVRFWLTGRGLETAWRRRIMRLLENPIARIATAPVFFLASAGLHGPLVTVTARKR
jgi:SAM-dependent methyltransferase